MTSTVREKVAISQVVYMRSIIATFALKDDFSNSVLILVV
jgi:hypothetical protein